MKLSEAILKGCEIIPKQAKGSYFTPSRTKACAIGAAVVGALGESFIHRRLPSVQEITQAAIGTFPILGEKFEGRLLSNQLFDTIINLNDHQGWTREQVAEWLDKQGL